MDEATLPTTESPESSPPSNTPVDEGTEQVTDPYAQYNLGQYASFDYSPAQLFAPAFGNMNDDQRNTVHELVILASRTDVASRRFEVEQSWEARLFDRGYQHLLPRRGGGWLLPGENSRWGPLSTADSSALYSTNTYGRDRDIIVAAITREIPEVNFFPQDATKPADVNTADQANKYKGIYERNNDLRMRLAELAYYYCTDGRVILYTREVLDGQRFGFGPDGKPLGREVTSVMGKLEGKVPMQAQYQKEMHFVQAYSEIDVTTAKARYPWIATKIRPGSCGIGEIELDKIARVNTKLALLGSYVTGDAMMREVTEQYSWLRPEMFFDDAVTQPIRDWLLENFPHGCLAVFAGQELAFVRAESMDDKIHVSHAMPGIGQNRRALLTSNISVQKRTNAWFDILDDFFRRTVPRRWYDSEAVDITALQKQDNTPGGSEPFQRQPGTTVDQLIFVEPTPTPQPALPEFAQWFFNDVSASLSGALDTLFGGDTDAASGVVAGIQRDQALARIGMPWNMAKTAFAESTRQAVICASQRETPATGTMEDGSSVSIDPNLLKGNVVCYAEYDSSFPETWRERETRWTEVVAGAPTNPFYAALLQDPANLRALADNVRMGEMRIPGEESVKKALGEIDQLKQQTPLPNPQKLQIESKLEQAKTGMQADQMRGMIIPPEAPQMIAQLEQLAQGMPDMISSIQVAQDESENHAVEAQVCFNWLNDEEGVKFKNGTSQEKAGWLNVYLYWQGHTAMAKKFAPGPQTQPPRISIPFDKIPPSAQTAALAKAGIPATPDQMQQKQLIDTQHKIAEKVVPKTVPDVISVRRISRGPQQPNVQ